MTGILVAVMAAITLASVAGTGLAQAQTNALTDRAALEVWPETSIPPRPAFS